MTAQRTAVYRWFNANEQLLYVGVSINVVNRIYQHNQRQANWVSHVALCNVEWFSTPEEAQAAEKAAIRTENPLYNLVHNPKRLGYSVVRRGESSAVKAARKHLRKYPDVTSRELAEKFRLAPGTIYNSAWWKAAQGNTNNNQKGE